jgi:hypothetical protein
VPIGVREKINRVFGEGSFDPIYFGRAKGYRIKGISRRKMVHSACGQTPPLFSGLFIYRVKVVRSAGAKYYHFLRVGFRG